MVRHCILDANLAVLNFNKKGEIFGDGMDAEDIEKLAKKFTDENYTKPIVEDYFIIKNAMFTASRETVNSLTKTLIKERKELESK